MEDSYTIGKVARMAGVGAETIRFYEKRGLLESPRRSESGYRLYDGAIIDRIRFIRSARDLGFSLDEILVLLLGLKKQPESCGRVNELLQRKKQEIEQNLQRLEQARNTLDCLIPACPGNGSCSVCTVVRPLPQQED